MFPSLPYAALVARCHCTVVPLDPLLGLLAAHDVSRDKWSSLLLRNLQNVASSEVGQDAMLGGPKWVTDVILHVSTWTAMLTKAKCEDWWNDP